MAVVRKGFGLGMFICSLTVSQSGLRRLTERWSVLILNMMGFGHTQWRVWEGVSRGVGVTEEGMLTLKVRWPHPLSWDPRLNNMAKRRK